MYKTGERSAWAYHIRLGFRIRPAIYRSRLLLSFLGRPEILKPFLCVRIDTCSSCDAPSGMNIDFRKLLTRSAPAITSFVFLVVAWNRVWNNTAPPWASDDDELEQLRAFYPDRYEDALESRNAFKFSAFEYPSRVV
jgi:hypothetical protein